MIVALFPNTKKQSSKEISKKIKEFLNPYNVIVAVEEEHSETIGAVPLTSIDPSQINFIITLGGDGTILRAIHKYPTINAPIMAINMGSLGFMADITLDEIYPSLEKLLSGEFMIQNRIAMEGITIRGESCFAVNEIVIHRAKNPCLVDLAIYVNNRYLNTFSADGVIIATPSGSTAYSLAAGGPILTPELNGFVLTPICPHTISNRPIVLMPEHEIRVEYLSHHDPVEVTYDGFPHYTMSTHDTLTINLSQKKFRLVTFSGHDYFSTLRTKLGWAGKLTPQTHARN